jgi:hypothetical protein
MASEVLSKTMTWQSKPLRYGGICDSCGTKIEVRATGWHNPDLKKVRCVACGTLAEDEAANETREMTPDPIGGSAALREARSRRDHKWVKGAAGEYLMDQSLHNRLSQDAVILTDRRVPGTKANIDHLVVASSGVWIIDTKNWKGRIEYKAPSTFSTNTRLFVDGKDRTVIVEAMYAMVIPVAQAIDDRSVPVNSALVFMDGDWAPAALPRLLMNRPYQHLSVWITPPKILTKMINEAGPLEARAIQALGKKLDQLFDPA